MHYYFDASALYKRYVREEGSTWVRSVTSNRDNTIFIAEITLAEVAAALAAQSRSPNGISRNHKDRVLAQFLADCEKIFPIIATERHLIDSAVQLAQQYRLRGYDAVQVATALHTSAILQQGNQSLTLVTADQNMLEAAQSEGLTVDDPRRYA